MGVVCAAYATALQPQSRRKTPLTAEDTALSLKRLSWCLGYHPHDTGILLLRRCGHLQTVSAFVLIFAFDHRAVYH